MNEFVPRIGTFFLLMGTGAMILFIASDASASINPQNPIQYELLCLGMLLLSVGFLFRRRAAPPPAAERFRLFHKYRESQKRKKEEKAKALAKAHQQKQQFPGQ